MQNHGGPVGSGTPVELLFWGDWWNTNEANPLRNLYIKRDAGIPGQRYFSELVQYRHRQTYLARRQDRDETKPLAAFNSKEDVRSVPDLIVDLIEDGVFPDPDDEKIAYVVFMAKGFTQSLTPPRERQPHQRLRL